MASIYSDHPSFRRDEFVVDVCKRNHIHPIELLYPKEHAKIFAEEICPEITQHYIMYFYMDTSLNNAELVHIKCIGSNPENTIRIALLIGRYHERFIVQALKEVATPNTRRKK